MGEQEQRYHIKSCNSRRGPQYPCDCSNPTIVSALSPTPREDDREAARVLLAKIVDLYWPYRGDYDVINLVAAFRAHARSAEAESIRTAVNVAQQHLLPAQRTRWKPLHNFKLGRIQVVNEEGVPLVGAPDMELAEYIAALHNAAIRATKEG